MSIKAIVIDVGHVLVQGSLLNGILRERYPDRPPKVLYDPEVYRQVGIEGFDQWVESVMTEKIELLAADPVSASLRAAERVPLTPYAAEFIAMASARNLALMCIGAVPDFIVAHLLRRLDVRVPFISSRVLVDGDQIAGVASILTPSRKRSELRKWRYLQRLAPKELLVIGDSLGDLQMMELVPRENRVAFNASENAVLEFCAHRYQGSMDRLLENVFYEQAIC